MPKIKTFEESLKLSQISLLMSGISLYPVKLRLRKTVLCLLFYFNFFWLYTDVIGEFFWLIEGIQVGKSFTELTSIAPCTTICLLATAKSTPMYYNRQILLKIVKKLQEIHPKIDNKMDKNYDNTPDIDDKSELPHNTEMNEAKSARIVTEIVENSSKFLNIVVMLLYYSASVVVVVFSFSAILAMGYEYYTSGETDLKLPFSVKYFFDPYAKEVWPLFYIHQVWSTFIAAFNVFGADTFLYVFCAYIQMHFHILCHNYEHLVSWSADETRARLVQLVKRHQELIELVDLMEVIFSKSILFNIISSSVLICLSGFNVTILDDNSTAFAFMTFLFMSLSQISLLCLFGDMLMRSSTKVAEAIYKCRWYDVDEGTKRNILFVITRAQKPCKLTAANFANLNLTAFTTILSRSWSYFALLKTMYK